MAAKRITWPPVIERAAEIVRGYNTPVTLRQVFYRLVVEQLLPNLQGRYKRLSTLTAAGRRDGTFPDLEDRNRRIHRFTSFDGPGDAQKWLKDIYRRNRSENQPYALYLGVEKATLVAQLEDWFGGLGIPILAFRGFASQTYKDLVLRELRRESRNAVLIYAGDFDASGEEILDDFLRRVPLFSDVVQVAVTEATISEYSLPVNPGKKTDSRAKKFEARHGGLYQVEIEALDPGDLKSLYQNAIDLYWDVSLYEAVLALEAHERAVL